MRIVLLVFFRFPILALFFLLQTTGGCCLKAIALKAGSTGRFFVQGIPTKKQSTLSCVQVDKKSKDFSDYDTCRAACLANTKVYAGREFSSGLVNHGDDTARTFDSRLGIFALDVHQTDCLDACRAKLDPL